MLEPFAVEEEDALTPEVDAEAAEPELDPTPPVEADADEEESFWIRNWASGDGEMEFDLVAHLRALGRLPAS